MTLLDAATLVWAVSLLALLLLGPFETRWVRLSKIVLRVVAAVAGVGFLAKVYSVFAPAVGSGGV